MTTITNTYICARCGRSKKPIELEQDQRSGFLLCKDFDACSGSIEQEGQAIETALLLEIEYHDKKRSEAITKLGQARHEYGLVDPVAERNKTEMARIAGDDQC